MPDLGPPPPGAKTPTGTQAQIKSAQTQPTGNLGHARKRVSTISKKRMGDAQDAAQVETVLGAVSTVKSDYRQVPIAITKLDRYYYYRRKSPV